MNIFQFISVQVLHKQIKGLGRVKVAADMLTRGGGGGSKFQKICLYNTWTLPYFSFKSSFPAFRDFLQFLKLTEHFQVSGKADTTQYQYTA